MGIVVDRLLVAPSLVKVAVAIFLIVYEPTSAESVLFAMKSN